MKLGYLVPQFPGQTHAFFWREIQALESLGVEVHIFSTRPPPRGLVSHDWSDEAVARTMYLGLGTLNDRVAAGLRLPSWLAKPTLRDAGAPALKSALISAPAAIALRRLCNARGIGHVHVHSAANAAMTAALSRLAGGPTYSLTLHGPMQDYGPAQPFKWSGADFGIVITRVLEKELRDALGPSCPSRLHVCPMGVDTDAFCPTGAYVPWGAEGPLRLFSCGRLNPVKGHDTAIAAVARLNAAGIPAHLTIAGEDDQGGEGYRHELESLIGRSGAGDDVTLLGAVNSDTILRHLRQAHIFVLASHHEPLGVAYMEAMACGCPTIGTDAGGVRELIRDGVDGRLVPPQNVEALADAIERLARDKDLASRLSEAGRARVVSAFNSRKSAQVIFDEMEGRAS